jgi:hypothetical protein
MLRHESHLPSGEYAFVAKEEILKREYLLLEKDFKYAMKKMGIYKALIE